MAKWGEGDPRWIVEERPDARNVNNWHWTEKDVSEWSVNKLKSLLINLRIDTDSIQCCITQVETHEGEAFIHNRKGKLIFFFDWRLVLNWEARTTFDDECGQCKGKIYILNFSEEYEVSDLILEVSISKSTTYDDIIRDLISSSGKEIIQQGLSIYVSDLKNEHFSSLILPKKEDISLSREIKSNLPIYPVKDCVLSSGNKTKTVNTVDITMNVTFFCTKENLYRCLTDTQLVKAFTQGGVDKMEAEANGSFELFGGNVCGRFIDLIPNTRIVQTWRFQGSPKGHFSEVSINFLEKDDSTEANLLQKYVPEDFSDSTKENWYKYYWDPIKRTFGYGYFLVSQDYSLF